ncbi:single-stranded DNA-binding protein [Seleniivibrio woodruffii]|uniref:single-stranded DNA-binding protein n=1 Tax=Seleniivibrio woodruffii TaxID=1078050 RepID=UPI0026EE77F9|nr:single-stranded DNA-binding protein [Seleniivibrio woodruffii]
MPYKNEVILLGNLTKDSELRFLPGEDTAILSFTIATTKPKKDKDKEKPFFIGATIWGEYAKIMEPLLKKGRQVLVTGELEYSSWDTEGQFHTKHTIKVEDVQLLSKPKSDSSSHSESTFDEPDADAAGGANEKTKKQTKNEKTG